jgi:hypothetical protein
MSQVFRHYRQVKVVSQGNSRKPQVQGVEEIYCNGERQVRYWGDPETVSPLDGDWSLFELTHPAWRELPLFPVEASIDWINPEPSDRHLRYINPNEVVIKSKPTRRLASGELLKKIRQVFVRGTQKIRKVVRNVPSALRLAWQELNR